jgi:hypothetical protein
MAATGNSCFWLVDWWPSIDASYQVSYHLAMRLQRKGCFRNRPIRNKNCLWRPCLLTDQSESNSHRVLICCFLFCYIYTVYISNFEIQWDRYIVWLSLASRRLYNILYFLWLYNEFFIAVKFLFFHRRDLNPHYWYTAAPFA